MQILICAATIMSYGIRAALLALMPELECLVCPCEIGANIETFARLVAARRSALTIFDADSVDVRNVLKTLGKDVLPSFGVQGMLGKIVVLTTKPDEEELFTLAKYGARAYLSGCLPGGDLAQVVRDLLDGDQLSLLDGRTFLDPDLALIATQCLQAERVEQAWQPAPEDEREQSLLTDLELRLLRGLSCGMDTHVAAKHAGVTYFKAKTTIPALEHKLQAGNRTGAVIRAWQLGLIDLPEAEMVLRSTRALLRQTGTSDEWTSRLNQRQMVTS